MLGNKKRLESIRRESCIVKVDNYKLNVNSVFQFVMFCSLAIPFHRNAG